MGDRHSDSHLFSLDCELLAVCNLHHSGNRRTRTETSVSPKPAPSRHGIAKTLRDMWVGSDATIFSYRTQM